MKIKHIVSVLLTFFLLFSSIGVSADDSYANACLAELGGYNVMSGETISGAISRGEMALISLRLQGIGNVINSGTSAFADVPSSHKYSGAISVATEMGIFSGFGDGTFRPDDTVRFNQAVKVIVTSLGYGILAEENGGYPNGYLMAAARINLLDGIVYGSDEELCAGDLAIMLSNILDEYPLERTYGTDGGWQTGNNTVREILENITDTVKYTGRVTETEITSLDGNSTLNTGQVRINNSLYYVGDTAIADYLGMEVTVFAEEKRSGYVPTISSFFVNTDGQREITLTPDEVDYINKTAISTQSGGKSKEYRIDTARFVYNGKYINPTQDDLVIFEGGYRIVDFENDGSWDLVFITEKENLVVERVGNNAVYFASGKTLSGLNGFSFETDDDETIIEIIGTDGAKADFSAIECQMGITFVCSKDRKFVKACLSDKKVSGMVTEMSDVDSIICIDGAQYKAALDTNGQKMVNARVGESATFVLSADGKIICETNAVLSGYSYAYVMGCAKMGNFESYSLKLITPGKYDKDAKTKSGTTTVSYKIQNGDIQVLKCADTVKIDGIRTELNEYIPSSFASGLIGKAIGYKVNGDGNVSDIRIYDIAADMTTLNLNTDIFAFGGYLGARNFVVDDKTKIICVPDSANADDNDFYVLVTLKDNVNYDVVPIEVDEETQTAEAVIIVETMDADKPASIDSDVKASIVGKISGVIDADGNECYKLQILTGDVITEIYTKDSDSETAKAVAALSTGDIIKYSLNAFGELDNIDVLASLYKVDEYFRDNPNTLREKVFGQCYEIRRHRLSESKNEFVDMISLNISSNRTATYEVLCTDGPHYYIFEKNKGIVRNASSDDVLDYVNVGDSASDIYMFVKEAEPQVVVIVKS